MLRYKCIYICIAASIPVAIRTKEGQSRAVRIKSPRVKRIDVSRRRSMQKSFGPKYRPEIRSVESQSIDIDESDFIRRSREKEREWHYILPGSCHYI